MRHSSRLTQPERLLAVALDCAVIAAACWILFGNPLPPLGDKGFWAYSTLLSILIGSKLVTPFYVKPVDAFAYAVPALVSLLLANDWPDWQVDQRAVFVLSAVPALVTLSLAIANIVANASNRTRAKRISDSSRVWLEILGRPQVVYTPLLFFAMVAFHRAAWAELVGISAVAMITVTSSFGVFFVATITRLRDNARPRVMPVAEVVAYHEPGILWLRQAFGSEVAMRDLLLVGGKAGHTRVFTTLNYMGRSPGALIRAIEVSEVPTSVVELSSAPVPGAYAYKPEPGELAKILKHQNLQVEPYSQITGLVAAGSTVERLRFEVIDEGVIWVGRLISSRVDAKQVTYQVVGGVTEDAVVDQKNTIGSVCAFAQQVGEWNVEQKRFRPALWLPELHTPVFLESAADVNLTADAVGYFPGTAYKVSISSVPDLVTHNTAILGILGVGKSFLCFELIERIIADGIKVICLDITGEYDEQLEEFRQDPGAIPGYEELLAATGQGGKTRIQPHVEEGGNRNQFAEALDGFIDEFLTSEAFAPVLILNPSEFEVWRQDSKPYQGSAAMASLSPTEVARLVSEAALKSCQELGKVNPGTARVCLVLEEAHSLVPEWNSAVSGGDQVAVNGTARAILQGRKFGLGCLLVTQRTANVTKTILNQCNTIFAMRTFDDTGKEFLSNYIGRDYTESLSAIPERHAVFFGKASSCENPVLIRLNDRDEFKVVFRSANPVPRREVLQPSPRQETVDESSMDDEEWPEEEECAEDALPTPDPEDLPF